MTADGYPVAPGITVPPNARDVTISANGEVQVKLDGQTATQSVGVLQIAAFPNEAGLDAQGDNLLLASAASGQAVTGAPGTPGFGGVMQGFVETSNVNVVSEITNLRAGLVDRDVLEGEHHAEPVVRLSDLFDGVDADRVIGPAPQPGGRITVEAPPVPVKWL